MIQITNNGMHQSCARNVLIKFFEDVWTIQRRAISYQNATMHHMVKTFEEIELQLWSYK